MMPANGQHQQAELIQRLADQAVERFPAASLESLAVDLEADAAEHPQTSETAIAIAVELRLRSAAGVRKWPAPSNTGSSADDDFEPSLAAATEAYCAEVVANSSADDGFERWLAAATEAYCAEVVANRDGLEADDVGGALDEESKTDRTA